MAADSRHQGIVDRRRVPGMNDVFDARLRRPTGTPLKAIGGFDHDFAIGKRIGSAGDDVLVIRELPKLIADLPVHNRRRTVGRINFAGDLAGSGCFRRSRADVFCRCKLRLGRSSGFDRCEYGDCARKYVGHMPSEVCGIPLGPEGMGRCRFDFIKRAVAD